MLNTERILFAIAIVILLGMTLISRKQSKNVEDELLSNLNSVIASSNYYRSLEVASNGIELNKYIKLISSHNDTIILKQLLNEDAILVFKIPESECSICIDSILQSLNETFQNRERDVAIFGCENNIRSLSLKHRTNHFFTNLYYSNELDRSIPALNDGLVCFFLLTEDFSPKHLFIPDRADTKLTRWYLKLIHSQYFDR